MDISACVFWHLWVCKLLYKKYYCSYCEWLELIFDLTRFQGPVAIRETSFARLPGKGGSPGPRERKVTDDHKEWLACQARLPGPMVSPLTSDDNASSTRSRHTLPMHACVPPGVSVYQDCVQMRSLSSSNFLALVVHSCDTCQFFDCENSSVKVK